MAKNVEISVLNDVCDMMDTYGGRDKVNLTKLIEIYFHYGTFAENLWSINWFHVQCAYNLRNVVAVVLQII